MVANLLCGGRVKASWGYWIMRVPDADMESTAEETGEDDLEAEG